MAQQSKAFSALAEDQNSDPRTHPVDSQPPITLVSGNPTSFFLVWPACVIWGSLSLGLFTLEL